MRVRRLLPLALLVLSSPALAVQVAAVFGGRVPCVERDGVQFCQGSMGARVESFDGVPLDADVTLPPADQTGPFPVIFDLHARAYLDPAGGSDGVRVVRFGGRGGSRLSVKLSARLGTTPVRHARAQLLSGPGGCLETARRR